jgi:hypothetical protein
MNEPRHRHPLQFYAPVHPGFSPPEMRPSVTEGVVAHLSAILMDIFGLQGMQALKVYAPMLFEDIDASLEHAYTQGAWEQSYIDIIEASRQANAATGRMMAAMVKNVVEDATPLETTARMLAAHAGVDPSDIERKIAESKQTAQE